MKLLDMSVVLAWGGRSADSQAYRSSAFRDICVSDVGNRCVVSAGGVSLEAAAGNRLSSAGGRPCCACLAERCACRTDVNTSTCSCI